MFRAVRVALEAGAERFGFRLVHFSVLRNHLHLIAEADDRVALARGMKGLKVRVARAINRVAGRRGTVFSDRYHAHALRSPSQTRNALAYVLNNFRKHEAQRGRRLA
ncbi:MAG: transposase, partial [Deltaproteobacteria bacterium]